MYRQQETTEVRPIFDYSTTERGCEVVLWYGTWFIFCCGPAATVPDMSPNTRVLLLLLSTCLGWIVLRRRELRLRREMKARRLVVGRSECVLFDPRKPDFIFERDSVQDCSWKALGETRALVVQLTDGRRVVFWSSQWGLAIPQIEAALSPHADQPNTVAGEMTK